MSLTTYEKMINTELDRLNLDIDLKIMCGKSYGEEARRHNMLLQAKKQIALRRRALRARTSFFGRALRLVSLF